MKKPVLILIFFSMVLSIHGQDQSSEPPNFPRYNIGFGGGMDYGGFGGRITIVTSERLEFFGAMGYNLLELGMNAGVDLRLAPQKRICPYVGAMYGYNAVIKITGAKMNDQTYYGPSFNFGLEFWSTRNPNYFNLEILLPIRSSEFMEDYKNLKNNPNIVFSNELIPIGVSLGYHFAF